MNSMNVFWLCLVSLAFTVLLPVSLVTAASVVREDDRVYIVDRTGERWDVTEAESAGFVPAKFQYGIGKNAFTPLGDENFAEDQASLHPRERVIGVALGGEAHAYSVKRLRRHEIANTTIGETAITTGY